MQRSKLSTRCLLAAAFAGLVTAGSQHAAAGSDGWQQLQDRADVKLVFADAGDVLPGRLFALEPVAAVGVSASMASPQVPVAVVSPAVVTVEAAPTALQEFEVEPQQPLTVPAAGLGAVLALVVGGLIARR